LAAYLDLPVFQRALKLQSAAAYVLQIFTEKADFTFRFYRRAGLFNFLPIDEHCAGEQQRLGTLTRGNESAFNQKLV
jgi:hypothetical protein